MAHTSLPIRNDAEKATWRKFKAIATEQHLDAATLLWKFINSTVEKFDGRVTKIDKFVDPNYVPKPEIFAPVSKASKYLIPLSNTELEAARVWFNMMMIYSEYFQHHSSKDEKRRLIEENDTIRYEYAWQRVMQK